MIAREARPASGVNVVGYFRAELGVGEAARLLTLALEAAGIPYVTLTWDRTMSRQEHPFEGRGPGEPVHDVNILCINADQTAAFASAAGPELFRGRYTIGVWAWEVDVFPETMFEGFDYVDEVWVPSDHAAHAVAAVSPRPVLVVPPPFVAPSFRPRPRAELGLPEGRFIFLFLFDFLSVAERKNPLGLIEAFSRAFRPDEGPVLVIKSINGDRRPRQLEQLLGAASRPDIVVRDGYLSADEKSALIASSDAVVSLHRSEGTGLVLAEAMALGKPVIATGYSGNLTFMNEENSFLVPYRLVAVPPGCDPYPVEARWAEPDLDAAAAMMRQVVDRPEEARDRGRRAQQEIRTLHSPEARAPLVAGRLAAVRRWRAAVPAGPSAFERRGWRTAGEATGVARALGRVDELLRQGPRMDRPSRFGPLGRLARRIVLRAVRPHAWHERQVAIALRDALETLAGAGGSLAARLARLQGEVGRIRAEVVDAHAELAGRLERLERDLGSLVGLAEHEPDDGPGPERSGPAGPQRTRSEKSVATTEKFTL
jgi:glycosyltransferase involved in cell wall biosynthesis